MNYNKKYLAYYLIAGLVYSIFYIIRDIVNTKGIIGGYVGVKIFVSNTLFFPTIIFFQELLGIHYRVELWWTLASVIILIGVTFEFGYLVFKFEQRFFKLHPNFRRGAIILISFALIFTITIPSQYNVKYDTLNNYNVFDMIEHLHSVDNYSEDLSFGYAFPITYYTPEQIDIINKDENISHYDFLKFKFNQKWLIYDDYDYLDNSSALRLDIKFDSQDVESIQKEWARINQEKIDAQVNQNKYGNFAPVDIIDSEIIEIYVMSGNNLGRNVWIPEANETVLGYLGSAQNGNVELALNYDLHLGSKEKFGNTLIHEITHYFYLTGKLGNKSEISQIYKLSEDKLNIIESGSFAIEKSLGSPNSDSVTIHIGGKDTSYENDTDYLRYMDLFDTHTSDLDLTLQKTINFSRMYGLYPSDAWDDETVARINAICFQLDPLTNYNNVVLKDYDICNQFDFPESYKVLYDTFIQELVYNYYRSYVIGTTEFPN